MWAISPEGRPANIGEVLVGDNHRSKLDVTTDLQAFAIIVTAEPYYAVRRPSSVVVLENEIRSDTAQQGVPEGSTSATGFGKTRPMASNDTSEGRQQNRAWS